ncbi:M48 metallopeptidase family protein [Chitinilyticum piscinae]|uniref:M48 family metallopeptidase n=1 Tax=Chitinilyticum piscinae TaxID=2866724 RepID=A0A8J7FM20_9NEIS|nr:YgjP-like metallopeptidase domain-containing protein [Chitinilyticum piscinae]MBE9608714.1 M48 family metallopeptidase [Chitinilyticum piscinae]
MGAPNYLAAYPAEIQQQALALLESGKLAAHLARKYPERHAVQSDAALYDYVNALKQRYLRNAPPVSKVLYDSKIRVVQHALGTNTHVSRVQGGKLKAKNEIRIATVFREAPEAFLRMIAVHELAHLKEKNHDKAFYQLCLHMEPAYAQLEFDVRAWLMVREAAAQS